VQELIEWIQQNWGEPLKASSIVILVLILLDKVGFTLLNAREQHRLEAKIDALLKSEGIEWHAHSLTTELRTSVRKQRLLLRLLWARYIIARVAGKFTKLRSKMNLDRISKTNVLGLLSAVAYFIKESFGYEIPNENIDTATNIVMFALMLIGVWVNRKKPKKDAFLQEGGE
jgi:hypothetical protein